jgi:hypothetical protein
MATTPTGPAGSPDAFGRWIDHVEWEGKTLFGWVHNETACDYAKYGQTPAMMTIASSTEYGLTTLRRPRSCRANGPRTNSQLSSDT